MAAILWSDVTALPGAAGFTSVSATAQTMILAVANTALDVSKFDGEDGAFTKLARANFAAHICALDVFGKNGPLASETTEHLARSFASPQGKSLFESTSFGKVFLTLIRNSARGPIVL